MANRVMIMMMKNYFYGMVEPQNAFTPYFESGPLSEILTITYLQHAVQGLNLHRI